MVCDVHPSAKLCCSKSVRNGSRAGTIQVGKTSGESPGPMRKTSASKECHECCLERLYSLKEVRERPFSADGIAYQQREKVNGFITAEASAHQAHLMRKGGNSPLS